MTLEFHSSNFKLAGSKIPWTKGSKNSKFRVKLENSQCTRLLGFTASTKLPDLQRVEGSRALQVPSLHQDPKDAGSQRSRINSKIVGFQGFKVPRFQGLSFQVFQGSMVPGCNDT